MRSRIPSQKSVRSLHEDTYVLSIKLPVRLIRMIDEKAKVQYRTRASLIRQTLAEKFERVA